MTDATTSIADLYNWRYAKGYTTERYKAFAQADLQFLNLFFDLSAFRGCDVGCGTGEHLIAMKEAGIRWPVGIDLSVEALRYVMTRDTVNHFILVGADVKQWSVQRFFDLVVCSLPPIGCEASQNPPSLFGALHRILKSSGVLLLKVFCLDHAAQMIGDFSVRYEGSTATKKSQVRLDEHYADTPEDRRTEMLKLPTGRETIDELARAGLIVDEEFNSAAACLPHTRRLPGTITRLARKP